MASITEVMAPPGRKPGDEDPARVQPVRRQHMRHHLPDRGGLAGIARGVARLEPVEAAVGVVGLALFRQQQGEAELPGQVRPAAAAVIAGGVLGAAMQRDHQGRPLGQALRHEAQHAERPRIGTEILDFREMWRGRPGGSGLETALADEIGEVDAGSVQGFWSFLGRRDWSGRNPDQGSATAMKTGARSAAHGSCAVQHKYAAAQHGISLHDLQREAVPLAAEPALKGYRDWRA
nr:hypothetical protein [Siccirubricoccus sp. G192]